MLEAIWIYCFVKHNHEHRLVPAGRTSICPACESTSVTSCLCLCFGRGRFCLCSCFLLHQFGTLLLQLVCLLLCTLGVLSLLCMLLVRAALLLVQHSSDMLQIGFSCLLCLHIHIDLDVALSYLTCNGHTIIAHLQGHA